MDIEHTDLKVETARTDDLVPYARNAKVHTATQVDSIANSIREFGFNDPVAVWTNANGEPEIVEGHGRVMAAKKLGMGELPVVYLDHLSDEQRRAYVHVHNQTTLASGFDESILAKDLDELDFDWESLGFEPRVEPMDYKDVEEDEPPEEVQEARTELGQVWQLGEHRLMCGSATDPHDMARLTGGAKADLLLTDPPYNVAYEGKTKEKLTIDNDAMGKSEFEALLRDSMALALDALRPGAAFYVWHASRTQREFEDAINKAGAEVKEQLIWAKSVFTLGRQDYQWKHEPCFYGWKGGAAHDWYGDRRQTTVWEDVVDIDLLKKDEMRDLLHRILDDDTPGTVLRFDKPARNAEHPTMKPVGLFAYQIQNSTLPGETVLDVFGGSGTSIVACEHLQRRCWTMELDPHYCDVIIERWEHLTGKTAVRVA